MRPGKHPGQRRLEKTRMQALLLLILQTVVTLASPCTDHDSLIALNTMAEGVPTSDEIVNFMADVSHKHFKGSLRCTKIELNETCAAGITLNLPPLSHVCGC